MTNLTTGINRRSFVIGAASVGALAAMSGLSACSPSESSEAEATNGGIYDVIVIGAGGAGMTAAISAVEGGASALILEKMGIVGGNTMCAEGGMNACCTKIQEEEGIEDSVELFVSDAYIGGYEKADLDLVTFLGENSNAAFERLDERGIPLYGLTTMGGASVYRCHRPETGEAAGLYMAQGLQECCAEYGISPTLNSDVTEILTEEGVITGVRVLNSKTNETIDYQTSAVIIATGGFGANNEMVAEYRPDLLGCVTTNNPGAQGEGIALGESLGADTVDIEQIQIHPTVEQTTSTLLSEGIRGDGAVLVNAEGNRFIDELLTRDVVSAGELEQTGGWAYAVFDKSVYDDNTSIEEKFVEQDLACVADSIEELAELMDIESTQNFIDAITTYNSCIDNGELDPMGRTASLYPVVEAPFYAIKVAPGIHHTMGGLKINVETEVVDTDGVVIPGLYAAGEVTGGIHGWNRLGGNSLCDINVFGHQAALSALSYIGKA